jgi:putative ABC transport system substrate-binding protein
MSSADAVHDALWLPQDSTTVEESSVLPLVLEKSWDSSLAVFSSNAAHVRRGVLFALYPNNVELGRNLASSAQEYLSLGKKGDVVPLKAVRLAVNVRTGGHLGLHFSNDQQRRFDLIFPQP